ncbi:hypothetical protein [Chryseobacterium rhizosphaerae]|uniref:hypothetical protein n=1 Tax=Chryseobacterium rhizosphaerae TaxID=395937 RepID=UPI003D0B66A5
MKKCLIYLGLLIFLLSPVSCKNETRNRKFLDKLSSIQNGLPSPYFNYYLYFKMDNGEILETNIDLVYEVYKSHYSKQYLDFRNFLDDLITQKETLKIADIKKYSKNDYFLNISKNEGNIERMDFENIKKTYLEETKEQSFIFTPKNLKQTQIRTILYKMFLDGYIISPNDLVGYYNIRKYKDEDFK